MALEAKEVASMVENLVADSEIEYIHNHVDDTERQLSC